MLNLIDEFSRECLALRIDRKLRSTDVIDVLSDLFILRGVPDHIGSDNGPGFVAKALRDRTAAVGARTANIAPGSPWENGYCDSFKAKLRDELLGPRECKLAASVRRHAPGGTRPGGGLPCLDPGLGRVEPRAQRAGDRCRVQLARAAPLNRDQIAAIGGQA